MKQKIDWNDHIAAWQGSGLKKAAYCREHGINRYSFYQKTREYEQDNDRGLTEIRFPGIPLAPAPKRAPMLEFHFEMPFRFRFQLNIDLGGTAE